MMKKMLMLTIMSIMLIGVVQATTCFTAVNVPQSEKYYWKAITYTTIEDEVYTDYLKKPEISLTPQTIGSGYLFDIRVQKDCFDHYLLSNKFSTGITSTDMNLKKLDSDYYTQNYVTNNMYTISLQRTTDVSTSYVKDITTGTIDGTNYLKLPPSFNEAGEHPEIEELKNQDICDSNLKITEQLSKIKTKLWELTDPSDVTISCSSTNIVDCVIKQGKATNQEITATAMVLSRICEIPTRTVYGISEASFNGIDLTFSEDKKHYWLEYYDGRWYDYEVTEDGTTKPTTLEDNCIDRKDNDGNSYVDCFDQACTSDPICNSWFTTSTYQNEYSTDLDTFPNPYNVETIKLGTKLGSVEWKEQYLDLRNIDLDKLVIIAQNQIIIDSTEPRLNKPATITFKLLATQTLDLKKEGVACLDCKKIGTNQPTNDGSKKTYSMTFEVPGAGQYEMIAPTAQVTPPPPVEEVTFQRKSWNTIKAIWNGTTLGTKAIFAVIIIGLIWLKRRKKNRYR